jgi:nitrogen fixation NifU-like protein
VEGVIADGTGGNATLQQLYQDIIREHHAHPRHAGPLAVATHQARADNPLCGDRVTLQLRVEGGRIAEALRGGRLRDLDRVGVAADHDGRGPHDRQGARHRRRAAQVALARG